MSGILDLISSQLGSSGVGAVSNQIGADQESTDKAVAAALPMLIAGLAKNANKSPEGAASLANALERDHDGSVIDNVMGLLGGSSSGGLAGGLAGLTGGFLGGGNAPSKAVDGDGILGHVLGNRRSVVEKGVAESSGLDMSQVAKLLPVLAPLVMGALGKVKKQQNLGAQDLASMLSQEKEQAVKRLPDNNLGGLAALLDSDGDGDVADDLMDLGSSLLSKLK